MLFDSKTNHTRGLGLFTAIGIGVGSIIGSGWLFAAYYAAQYMGPASYLSWIVGACLALILALLLAEIASMFKQKALFSRLLTLSHNNPDLGFVIAISSWLGMVIVIPAEAAATVQYLSTVMPSFTHYFFHHQQHTLLGSISIIFLVMIYSLINYWGIQSLAKASNILAVLKLLIPSLTAIIIMIVSFNPGNLSIQGFAPYGYSRIFSAIVVCGIFYAFYGFSMIAMYSAELSEPRKNIPRALVLSVLICLILYLLLQTAFLFGLPPEVVAKGWGNINFTSPLVQLLMLFHLHILSSWAFVLYFDATLSPSGTGIIYMGSSARTLTGMAKDKQLPRYFNKVDPQYHLSRRSLVFTALVCCLSVLVFKNWQQIMIIVTVFQLISCVAIPISFVKFRIDHTHIKRHYRVKYGTSLSFIIYLVISYLLIQATTLALFLALLLHLVFFIIYAFTTYEGNTQKILLSLCSAWSLFIYLAVSWLFGLLQQSNLLPQIELIVAFVIVYTGLYYLLVNQKNYNP